MSRLIVLSLPSALDTEGLMAHFSTLEFPITDAKVLCKKDGTSRRIGFIGYKVPGHALAAKDWFNGTWLNGSRIIVDFARELTTEQLREKRESKELESMAGSKDELKKRDTGEDVRISSVSIVQDCAGNAGSMITELNTTEGLEDSDAAYLARRKRRRVGEDSRDELVPTGRGDTDSVDVAAVNETASATHRRLFLRNLAYTATEADIRSLAQSYGHLEEVHMPKKQAATSKGLAYVSFSQEHEATEAMKALDGKVFLGRILHVLRSNPAPQPNNQASPHNGGPIEGKSNFRVKKSLGKATEVGRDFNWSLLYMNSDAILESLSRRLNVRKADVLDPASADAAAQLALAETMFIRETREYLVKEGINMASLHSSAEKDSRTLLLKNLPASTTKNTLVSMLASHGSIARLALPPSGLLAVVQYDQADDAAGALKALAYSRLGNSVLYVDRAPAHFWQSDARTPASQEAAVTPVSFAAPDAPCETLFIRNLPVDTTHSMLRALYEVYTGFRHAKVVHREEVPRSTFAFVEFNTTRAAQFAQQATNGILFQRQPLLVGFSRETEAAQGDVSGTSSGKGTKIVIKNLPFEATTSDLRSLLQPFGRLLSLRIPQKADRSSRGFAFAHFAASSDANAALVGLRHTHLLGRHLIIQESL